MSELGFPISETAVPQPERARAEDAGETKIQEARIAARSGTGRDTGEGRPGRNGVVGEMERHKTIRHFRRGPSC